MSNEEIGKPDGRHARVDRGKIAAIEALLAIFAEGCSYPTAADIAKRAGISERTLFRYFGTFNDFISESVGFIYPTVSHYFTAEPPAGDLEARIKELIQLRIKFVGNYGIMALTVDLLAVKYASAKIAAATMEDLVATQLRQWLGDEGKKLSNETFVIVNHLLTIKSVVVLHSQLGRNCVDALTKTAVTIIKENTGNGSAHSVALAHGPR